MKKISYLPVLFIVFFFSCYFPYVYYDQSTVLIKGADIDSTLKIAENELQEGGFDSILTIWVIRDQIVTKEQALVIKDLYFKYIDKVDGEFQVWHFAWAISNLYRNGNAEVKTALQDAYNDAVKRPEKFKQFKQIAIEHIKGTKIYMGDIHDWGRAYAHTHIIVPGNSNYLQSLDEYKQKKALKKIV